MKFTLTQRKQTASLRITGSMLAIAPLWLMLAAANTSAYAQTSNTAAAISTTTSSPADWTEFHRDNMQRWNLYETVLGVNNVASLQLMWQSGCCGTDFGLPGLPSPAVANGVVYVGSDHGTVYALNASTGAKLWSYTTGGQLVSSPAVANGVVYIGSGDRNVYALNASTGAKLWSYTTGAGVESSPAVANGVVYVGSDDDNLYALNASTGAKLWSFATGSECVFFIPQPPGFLNAPCKIFSSPAVANGVVYVSSTDGNLYALNASTGAKLWSNPAVSYSSPAVANGVVYIGSTALNANTGAVLWGFNTGDNAGDDIFTSSPAVANGVVYIATENGNMFALNASTGAQLWTYPAGDVSPVVVNGTLYVGSAAFNLTGSADLYLRIRPTLTTVHQGDLLTYAFPVWNLGPHDAVHEVLNTQVPEGTTFDYIRISGTPGLGTCTHPPYQGTGQIVCHENSAMAPNTTWTVRLTVKVTAPAGTVITENAATIADTFDPNLANNMATVSLTVQ